MRYFKGDKTLKDTLEDLITQRKKAIKEFKEKFNVDFDKYMMGSGGPLITENNNPEIKLKSRNIIAKTTKEGKAALEWWGKNVDTNRITLSNVIFRLFPGIKERFEPYDGFSHNGTSMFSVKTGLGIVDAVETDDEIYFATEWDEIEFPLGKDSCLSEITKKEFYEKKAVDEDE
jgi:hypothetical protein